MDKDTRKVVKAAERQGFEVRISKTGHPMIYRDGRFVTKVASTPSDVRGLKNLVAALRREGFVWPPRR